jgi:hypothetical protein
VSKLRKYVKKSLSLLLGESLSNNIILYYRYHREKIKRQYWYWYQYLLNYLRYFEVHLTEHCNLNCASCAHFSPLADEIFADIKIFERDMNRMSELFHKNVGKIRLMGGEPLLHPKLLNFVHITRKAFPNPSTSIDIVTNGLLLLKQEETFWKTCKDNNIRVSVTKYPINLDFEKMVQTAKLYGVLLNFDGTSETEPIKTMCHRVYDLRGSQNYKKNFKACGYGNGCIFLKDGRLSTCGLSSHFQHFNKYFSQNIEVTDADSIDIFKSRTAKEILRYLTNPIPLCRYCNVQARTYGNTWCVSKKDIKEWT